MKTGVLFNTSHEISRLTFAFGIQVLNKKDRA
jgi:hypothetical protein